MPSRGDNAKIVPGNPGGHKTLPYSIVIMLRVDQATSLLNLGHNPGRRRWLVR